ncbi:hypothetical protein OR263_14065 [Streptomyces sp. NEAU-H22]|uniref:hypothetical protein n=1 Tax=Streptomyces sp. NEAU-H22 TaxID=2994655 RepID=UPI0022561E23|nr:hypothetical protein [Streptomyces sp. NEAU-H22]MCX3287816.1 hypothetical protein [Streptomyces sp. NEAU-H22]
MTTCSSSPRSNEPAIPHEPNGSAQPSAETTVATGTHQVEQTSAQPAAGPYEAYPAGHSEPAAGGFRPAGRADAEPVALGSHPAAGASARSAVPEPDPAAAQSPPPAEDWLDPAEARPAAPVPNRPDPVGEPAGPAPVPDRPDPVEESAGPAHMDSAAPDHADPLAGPSRMDSVAPDDADPSLGPGPDDAGRPGARPFVIRSLDDNPVELRPGTGAASGAPYGDAVSDLVHAAVADRPLEEVVDLIVSLEESPDHTQARVDALRTAGVRRSVEDVSRMIALLTKPPRDADCADEAIRAAAAHRPVEEVTRLVTLLHKEPQESHVREEALRAAATGRSVGELVELIDRLGLERLDRNGRRTNGTSRPEGETAKPEVPGRPGKRRAARPGSVRQNHHTLGDSPPDREPATDRYARSVSWSGWLAALALAVCAVVHFPLQRGDASLRLHAFALGLSVLCTVLALLLALRPVALVLAGAVLVPTVLAGAQAYGSSFPSASLTRAVDLALAPPWLAAGVAGCAALLALVALVFRVLAPIAARQWEAAPASEAHGVAE